MKYFVAVNTCVCLVCYQYFEEILCLHLQYLVLTLRFYIMKVEVKVLSDKF
jgi:hypothetical protein